MSAAKRKEKRPASVAGKTRLIQLRAKEADQRLIDSAAQLTGKNRTEFMMESAVTEAQKVLLDQTVFRLDAAAWDRLMDILDAPGERNPRLAKLLKQKAPWEK